MFTCVEVQVASKQRQCVHGNMINNIQMHLSDSLSSGCLQVLLTSCVPTSPQWPDHVSVSWICGQVDSQGIASSPTSSLGADSLSPCAHVCPMTLWYFMDLENFYWLQNIRLLSFLKKKRRSFLLGISCISKQNTWHRFQLMSPLTVKFLTWK